MFFADASGGTLFPAPRHLNAPDRPTISQRPTAKTAAAVVTAIAIAVAATITTWALWPSAATEPAPMPPAGPVVASTTPSTVPDILGGHTPASQLLLTLNNGGTQ